MEFKVNIYIETSIHGPSVKDGWYGYVIEYKRRDESIETREGFGSQDNTTENKLALTAFKESLLKLTKPCSIRLFVSSKFIRNTYENNWFQKWKKNNWKNARGNIVGNAELWKEIDLAGFQHQIQIATDQDTNEYHTWLKDEIHNRMSKKKYNKTNSKNF